MFKNKFFLLAIAILIILSFIGYYVLNKEKQTVSPIVNAVPQNASLFIKTDRLDWIIEHLHDDNLMWKELAQIDNFSSSVKRLEYVYEMMDKHSEVENLLDGEIAISVHFSGKNDFELLYIIPLDGKSDQASIEEFMMEQTKKNATISKRTYDKSELFDVKKKLKKDDELPKHLFSYSFSKGFLLLSVSSILVENAIRQLNSDYSLSQSHSFKKIAATAGKNVQANVYINYKNFTPLLQRFIQNDKHEKLAVIDEFADWSEMDLNLRTDAILLSGFTLANDSLHRFLNLFKQQDAVSIEITEVIPASSSLLYLYSFSDYSLFYRNYKKILDEEGRLNAYLTALKPDKNENIAVDELIKSIAKNELAYVATNPTHSQTIQNEYFVLQVKDRYDAEEKLKNIVNDYALSKKKELTDFVKVHKGNQDSKYILYALPSDLWMKNLFQGLLPALKVSYFCLVDNYLIFGQNNENLVSFINAYEHKKTLANNIDYRQFSNSLSSKSSILFYNKSVLSESMYHDYLNDPLFNNFDRIKKIQGVAMQLSASNGMFFTNLSMRYDEKQEKTSNTNWEIGLDAAIQAKPKFVLNHQTKEQEIFVQDKSNKIYLIGLNGEMHWKKQLPEKIKSEIYQVDFYKNGKLQMLFSSENYLFLVDRLGNYVENYPIKLKNPASNGLVVFDYDRNKKYRILLAGKDKKVYLFDIEGKPIEGWAFGRTQGLVHSSIQHFVNEGKDYIVFSDDKQTYILNRRGETRLTPKVPFAKSKNNLFFYEKASEKSNARLVTTTSTGAVMFLYFDGQQQQMKPLKASANHYFMYTDLTGDDLAEFVYLDQNKIYFINRNRKTFFSKKFDENILYAPMLFQFSDTQKFIGITASKNNKIYLFDTKGKVKEGFPLEGSSMFSVLYRKNKNGKGNFNLIIANQDNFLYNYQVN